MKDSLGGNSKTKLLANISPKVAYIGDTISTLMFAKRTKIIRCKVEPNENIADNFESLRTEIRKLREELAQTKFIKTLPSLRSASPLNKRERSNYMSHKELFMATDSILESNNSNPHLEETFKLFEENEVSYKSIIEHQMLRLKEHSKGVPSNTNFKNLFEEKKHLEATVINQQKLIGNFPTFTRIFSENVQLKKKLKMVEAELEYTKEEWKDKECEVETLLNTL